MRESRVAAAILAMAPLGRRDLDGRKSGRARLSVDDFRFRLDDRAVRDVSHQSLRFVRSAAGLDATHWQGLYARRVSNPAAVSPNSPPVVLRLFTRLLEHSNYDGGPPTICAGNNGLHHSRHPIRRAGPRRRTWGFVRTVSALGTNVNSESRAPTSVQDGKLKVRLKERLRCTLLFLLPGASLRCPMTRLQFI